MTTDYDAIPSPHLIEHVKYAEGYAATPYLCPAGYCTIGYGTNLEAHPEYIPYQDFQAAVRSGRLKGAALRDALRAEGMRWSPDIAEEALVVELKECAWRLRAHCPEYAALVEAGEIPRAEVLCDMAYNMGIAKLLQFKDMLKKLRAAVVDRGEYGPVADAMLRSRWATQVGARALTDARQMRTGWYA